MRTCYIYLLFYGEYNCIAYIPLLSDLFDNWKCLINEHFKVKNVVDGKLRFNILCKKHKYVKSNKKRKYSFFNSHNFQRPMYTYHGKLFGNYWYNENKDTFPLSAHNHSIQHAISNSIRKTTMHKTIKRIYKKNKIIKKIWTGVWFTHHCLHVNDVWTQPRPYYYRGSKHKRLDINYINFRYNKKYDITLPIIFSNVHEIEKKICDIFKRWMPNIDIGPIYVDISFWHEQNLKKKYLKPNKYSDRDNFKQNIVRYFTKHEELERFKYCLNTKGILESLATSKDIKKYNLWLN